MKTFQELNLPPTLFKALGQMQFVAPTEVQAASIPPALEGRDILGTAQTGTGKTGAFGIPLVSALNSSPKKQGLILAPTRELAAQIHSVLSKMGIGSSLPGALVVGGESFNRQADTLRRGARYIVATPGRLNDHLEARTVSLNQVSILVMDEFDRMLDMGFAPQIKQIMRHVPAARQTLLFSATLPEEVKNLAGSYLRNPVRVAIGHQSQPAPKVDEQIVNTTAEGKAVVVLEELEKRTGKVLIFTRTQSRTERLARFLYNEGHKVVCLHGGRTQGQRKEALLRFRNGTYRVMVATDLAGRGIDVEDIEHVINFDVPQSREDYIHRIGRTGRFGKSGKALNLLTSADISGEQIFTGIKPKPRLIYKTRRWKGRR